MRIFYLFYLAVALLAAVALFIFFGKPSSILTNDETTLAKDIPAMVDSDNYALRAAATELSAGCTTDECRAYTLFTAIREEALTSVVDKTVLFASYLENLAIQTEIFFENGQPYVLACGLEREKMYEHMVDLRFQTPEYADTVRLAAGQRGTKLISPPISEGELQSDVVAIDIHSTHNVAIYLQGGPEACSAQGTKLRQICTVDDEVLLVVSASDMAEIAIKYVFIDFDESKIPAILYESRSCIPFDFAKEAADAWL
jgi:hypothetical protein